MQAISICSLFQTAILYHEYNSSCTISDPELHSSSTVPASSMPYSLGLETGTQPRHFSECGFVIQLPLNMYHFQPVKNFP